jgi:hypothetical protein
VAGLVVTACGGFTSSAGILGNHGAKTASHQDSVPGMADMPTGDGLTAEASGFRFAPVTSSLPTGQPASLQFRILGADDKPVTAFEPDQTKLMQSSNQPRSLPGSGTGSMSKYRGRRHGLASSSIAW